MSKVLIVDDEILTIEYLKSFSSWRKFGCTQIDSVWIATKALECFKKERHSIVFMDVRMPGVDGLTLSREILKIAPDTMIVIMTAFQEYEYVREAMHIGVKYFLSKHEITEEKLDEVLEKIIRDIRRNREYKRAVWNDWLRGIWETGIREELPEKGRNPYFLVLITLRGLNVVLNETKETYINEELVRELEFPRIAVRAFSRLEIFTYGVFCEYTPLISEQSQQEDLSAFLVGLEKVCLESSGLKPVFFLSGLKTGRDTADLGEPVTGSDSVGELTEVCSTLKQFAHSILWNRRDVVHEREFSQYTEAAPDIWPEHRPEEWDKNDLRVLLEKGRESRGYVEMRKLAVLRSFLSERVGTTFLREQERKTGLISIEQLLRAGLHFLESEGTQKNGLVQQTLEYIRAHYSEDISSTTIADALRVSDGHLRSVFKRELTCTIKDYILQYRIERSKELLLKDEKKIYEIAARCGFMSSQHFSRVFRQETGMTPGEYKQSRSHK